MYAVIKTGGKQYRVAPDDVIKIEKLAGAAGEQINFTEVLMVGGDGDPVVGTPLVEGASVAADAAAVATGTVTNVAADAAAVSTGSVTNIAADVAAVGTGTVVNGGDALELDVTNLNIADGTTITISAFSNRIGRYELTFPLKGHALEFIEKFDGGEPVEPFEFHLHIENALRRAELEESTGMPSGTSHEDDNL